MRSSAHYFIGGSEDRFGHDTKAAVAVVDQPIARSSAQTRYTVSQHDFEALRSMGTPLSYC